MRSWERITPLSEPLDPIFPPFLLETEPMEPEDMPLQLALLTMEIANLRTSLAIVSDVLEKTASLALLQHRLMVAAAAAIRPGTVKLDG